MHFLLEQRRQDNLELYQEVLGLAHKLIELVNAGAITFEHSRVIGDMFYQSDGSGRFCVYTPTFITFVYSIDEPVERKYYVDRAKLFQMKGALSSAIVRAM